MLLQFLTLKITSTRDFLGGPVVRTLCSQCRGHRFNPWSGTKILHAVQCSKEQNYIDVMASTKTTKIYIYLFVSQLLFSVSFMCLIPFFIVYSLTICILQILSDSLLLEF